VTAALEEGEWSVVRHGRTLPPGKNRYPFYRSLGGGEGFVTDTNNFTQLIRNTSNIKLTNHEILKFGSVQQMSNIMHKKNQSFQTTNTYVFPMTHTAVTTISIYSMYHVLTVALLFPKYHPTVLSQFPNTLSLPVHILLCCTEQFCNCQLLNDHRL